jgi:hypothetical protein
MNLYIAALVLEFETGAATAIDRLGRRRYAMVGP